MRTTLEIDDDVMQEARALSTRKQQSIGRTISELVRRGLKRPEPKVEMKNGVPVWVSPAGAPKITSEMVAAALDEEFREDLGFRK